MTFLRNTWYVAAYPRELTREPMAREMLGEKVMFFRGEAGEPRALGNLCPHRFASLHTGKLVGDTIECPYHGLRFDVRGACVHNPHGDGQVPPEAKVKAYPLAERHDLIWIWMGEPARADVALIPDFSIMARPDWVYFDGYIDIAADYQLVTDNLMDLSHIQFLHPFLSSPEWVAKQECKIRQEGDVVHVENRVADIAVFPVFQFVWPDVAPRGEQWMDVRWDPPSQVYIDIRYRTPEIEICAPNGHFMTPARAGRTHYFYRIGRNVAVDNAELTAKISAKVAHAFAHEDEPVIEDQQRNLGEVDLLEARPVILKADAAAVRARRLLAKLIRNESNPVPANEMLQTMRIG